MHRYLAILPAVFSLALWILNSTALAQSREELIQGAKKEGKVVWYGILSVEDMKRLAGAFEQKYPFIQVETYRASTETVANKIVTETQAGRYLYDLVNNGAFEIWPLYKRGLLGKYMSPESKPYPASAKDPEGYWNDLYDSYYVIGYNTRQVSPREVPNNWEDLLDPKWKGKIALDTEDHEWYMAMLASMGEEKGKGFMKRLARQDLHWRKGHTLIAQQMVAGEFPVALIYAHRGEKMKAQGAPIDWSDASDPIVSGMRVVSIGARPPNPNAARLMFDFVISKEGQSLIRSFYRIPGHPDVEPLSPKLDPKKLKLLRASPQLAEHSERHIREFRQLFGLK
jgi:iron(III) transport system substrate-binding protein